MFSTWLLYVSLIDARLWTVLGRLRKNSGCGVQQRFSARSGAFVFIAGFSP